MRDDKSVGMLDLKMFFFFIETPIHNLIISQTKILETEMKIKNNIETKLPKF